MSGTPAHISILGFGRSGTTWLSDIVSKASGQALLFEPWHPEVMDASRELSYRSAYSEEESTRVARHLVAVLAKEKRVAWLLRNHLPWPLHETDPALIGEIWEQVEILGFKTIRAPMAPDWIVEHFGRRMLYVVRHPLAVVASILRRRNFWEFGWPDTYEIFARNAFAVHDGATAAALEAFERRRPARSDVERIATMWAVTHAVALPKLEKLGIAVLHYEDFYDQPFEAARRALNQLGLEDRGILPTYLFTPAMTTLRTMHGQGGLKETGGASIPPDFFWRDTLTGEDQKLVLDVVADFGVWLYEPDGSKASATIS
jgi:hypothetical protein